MTSPSNKDDEDLPPFSPFLSEWVERAKRDYKREVAVQTAIAFLRSGTALTVVSPDEEAAAALLAAVLQRWPAAPMELLTLQTLED